MFQQQQVGRAITLVTLLALLYVTLTPQPSFALDTLPPIVFVARARLATSDYIFTGDLGPSGQLTSGLSKFAPGSKLLLRRPDGLVQVLIDTTRPAGDPLNPLGLKDLQSPDVSFDATRIVFAGSSGPEFFQGKTYLRPHFSWRLYELSANGQLRQLTHSDRQIDIPDGEGNAETYSFYDDLFPAYLADGRIVFSSSRYPSRAHYDGRPTFNLYVIDGDGANLHRITTERGGALHPTPLPDGRILWSRWWINFNQPSETGIYNRADNAPGFVAARDEQGQTITQPRRVIPATPTPLRTTTPAPRTTATPAPTPAPQIIRVPVTGYRLPDGTLVYSNTNRTFAPARGRLADGTPIREAPNTWHLMTVNADGTAISRYAWTPRYNEYLTDDSGHDTYNAAQPALIFAGAETLVAYTTQRDGTMAHTTLYTGIRVARPGIDQIAANTTESIAGYRWDNPRVIDPPFALHPAGMPDGRILFSQTSSGQVTPGRGSYRYKIGEKTGTLALQSGSLRYQLWMIRPDGSQAAPLELNADLGDTDAMDAKPVVARPIGQAPGQWRPPVDQRFGPISDDPRRSNVPWGLLTGDGRRAYPWSTRKINEVALTVLHNSNVYANPPLSMPYINNSPPLGSVAFADIYIDASQFGDGQKDPSDASARAVKWLTVPVDERGSFTASAPADTPVFIILRGKDGRVVRGGNRSMIAIAQGNAPGRAGQRVTCIGCHMGHASGSVESNPPTLQGWTNIAPSASASATSEVRQGAAARLNSRRGFIPAADQSAYQDRSPPWIAAGQQGAGEATTLDWPMPVAILDIRLVGAEPGQSGFSNDYRVSGELSFYLNGAEIAGTRQAVSSVAPAGQNGTLISLERPIAADQMVFTITDVSGQRYGGPAPAALAQIEVTGQGATPGALAARP